MRTPCRSGITRETEHLFGDDVALHLRRAAATGPVGGWGLHGAATGDATWSRGKQEAPALTVGGGTAEVQRNIVAEKVLGLPRDP